MKLAQGILCGPWALAFSFGWARQIVDEFELSPIPKSPAWLLGATNVDGNILPVVDLNAYLGVSALSPTNKSRLLIGGKASADSAGGLEDAIAIAFDGLPQQLSYEPRALTYASALPPKLRELCTGVGSNTAGNEFLEMDDHRLLALLGEELSAL